MIVLRTARLPAPSWPTLSASPGWLVGVAVAGTAAIGLTVLASPPGVGAGAMTVRALSVALPVGVGLVRLRRLPADRFARFLVGAALLYSLASLSASSDSAAYSLGRVSAWLVEPLLILLVLTFPRGRLESANDRRLVGLAGLVALGLYLPTAFTGPFPEPSPWTSCAGDCPANAFALNEHVPTIVSGLIQPLREVLTVVIFGLVTLSMVRRTRDAGPIMQRALAPVMVVTGLRTLAVGLYLPMRAIGNDSSIADALGWAYVHSLPAIALAFAGGMVAWRLFVADALEQLAATLRHRPHPDELRQALATALRDPELTIFFRAPESRRGWIDESGHQLDALPDAAPGRAVTIVSAEGGTLGAIVHRDDLADDHALLDALTAHVITAHENALLVQELRSSVDELSLSRARLVSVADEERRRIERDLHDGAQQRLVSLQINAELLAERLDAESPRNAQRVRVLENEITTALQEVRSFGRGVFPPLLADRGLADALRAVARTAPIPTTIDDRSTHRYTHDIESAAYFGCLEALQNASKHAHGASRVRIVLSEGARLRFEVSDDGAGFDVDSVRGGSGLTHLRDRLSAVGGRLEIESTPGRGTRVTGIIPLRYASGAARVSRD